MNRQHQVALVLSTGGARGIAHIGVIEELERQGYEITSIAGSSMGALIAAAYATGRLEACKEALFSLRRWSLFRWMDVTWLKGGFLKGDKLMRRIGEIIPDTCIEDLKLPYVAVATDLQTEREVVFHRGRLLDAVRASIAIPGVLQPFRSGESVLIDGGLACPLPLEHVARQKDDLLVASVAYDLCVGDRLFRLKPSRYFFMSQPSTIAVQTNIRHELARFSPDVVIRSQTRPYTIFQFDRAKELVELGRMAARKALEART